jgi:hypothetical protein
MCIATWSSQRPATRGSGAILRPSLLRAYCRTRYEAGGIAIRVGRRCAAMDRLLLCHGVRSAVLISAHNPRSRPMPGGWNRRMQMRLGSALRRRRVLLAHGRLRSWSEAHFLVFGAVGPMARLARRFRQNAIVIVRLRQPARLVLTL